MTDPSDYARGYDTSKARLFVLRKDGTVRVTESENDALLLSVWFRLPRGVRAAFRNSGDTLPVLPWSFVDRP